MLADRADHAAPWRRRWKPLAALAVLATLLHVGALNGALREAAPQVLVRAPAMQVRRVETPTPVSPAVVAAVRAEPAEKIATHRPPPTPPVTTEARAVAAELPKPVPEPARSVAAPKPPPEPVLAAAPAIEPVAALASSAPAPAPAPEAAQASTDLPVYRTRMPPTQTLHYALKRGFMRGTADLQWQADERDYKLRFEAQVAGLKVMTQTSEGGFDDAGVAPLRFTDQRLRGELRATNFQREAGKITFSGPTTEFPLVAGAQDRLSWMIQLAAVLAGEPGRREPGSQITMAVAGTRGDIDNWVFRHVADEVIETGQGPLAALKFVREPREPHDTRVEVWLDARAPHLPLRAQMGAAGSDDAALELLLQAPTVMP